MSVTFRGIVLLALFGALTASAAPAEGQVRDASLLIRGRELYVPSTPQRVTAFLQRFYESEDGDA